MIAKIIGRDLVGVTASKLLVTLGSDLVTVFIPLMLLSAGLKLWQVCVFYVGYAVCKLLINYPSARLINHYGVRLGLIVGVMATVMFLLLLTLYVSWKWELLLVGLAIMMAVQNSFTWNSQHLFIARAMDMERKSRDLATMEGLVRVVGIVAPLAGGFIAVLFGQAWLTGIAAAITLAAIVPIWNINRLAGGHQKDDSLRYSLKFAPLRDVVANFGFNAHGLVGVVVWPMYLAVFVPDFRSIGIVMTVAALVSVVVLQVIGRRGDKGKTHQVLVEGTAGTSIIHIIRILAASNPITIMVVSIFYSIAAGYQQNPWTSLYYTHTRTRGINYIMSMEIAGDVAYIAMWGVLGIVAYMTGGTSFFTIAFGAAAALTWLCLLMNREPRQ